MAQNLLTQYGSCPLCKCDDFTSKIMVGDWEQDSKWVWRDYHCECGFSWREVYTFSYNETLDSCEPLDDNGNIIQ